MQAQSHWQLQSTRHASLVFVIRAAV